MNSLLIVCTFVLLSSFARHARAREATAPLPAAPPPSAPPPPPAAPPTPERVQPIGMRALPEGPTGEITVQASPAFAPSLDHPTPRVKFSYMRHGIGNGSGGSIPLDALHLDLYPLSWRWLRAGVELEAGRGRGTILGRGSSVSYGMMGVNLGLQIPRRFTPFIEGRLAAGIIQTRADGAVMIPGTPISVGGGASFIATRGIDVGVEFYTFGRNYLSAAVGWMRTSWTAADFNSQNQMITKNVSYDSFLLKIGLGF